MTYIPNTDEQQKEMLRSIGANSIEDLLTSVPQEVRLKRPLNLPAAMSELEIRRTLSALGNKNIDTASHISFLGAGSYEHYIPSAVPHLVKRSEFYTSYTPYQPEVSQGMLQAMYEYQTMICSITGMDVANASLYDGSTSVAEAALMAVGPSGRGDVLVSKALDPQYRTVLHTYANSRGFNMVEVECADGTTSIDDLRQKISETTSAVIVQQPNFFGCVEDMHAIEQIVHSTKALFIAAITEPASLGVLAAPGEYNADIVACEGQSMGTPVSFGGPALGVFACKQEYVRRLPGRLVGKTVDNRGQTGYVLTLQTREQHIRREKATSNICTNQALMALSATVYLSMLGKEGFREVGYQAMQKAHYAQEQICAVEGFELAFDKPFFDEFTVRCPGSPEDVNKALLKNGIIGGYPLAEKYPDLPNTMLFCITEKHSREEIDRLVSILRSFAANSSSTNFVSSFEVAKV